MDRLRAVGYWPLVPHTCTHFYHAVEDQISCSIHLNQQPHFKAVNCARAHTHAHTLTD